MHPFVERLAERIEQPWPDTIAASLTDAGEIMRMWRFFKGDPSGPGVCGPFSEDIEFPHVYEDDIEHLKRALVSFARNHPHHANLSTAVSALRYLAAAETRTLLVGVLRDCIGRDSMALYQTILALEALGESLYGPDSMTSCDDVQRNESVARTYLCSHPLHDGQ